MSVVLCGSSALDFWRSDHPIAQSQPKKSSLRKLPNSIDTSLPAIQQAREICGIGQRPLHIMVLKASSRRRIQNVEFHVRSQPFPSGSLVRIDDNVFVASPEMCFVQVAAEGVFPITAIAGVEFCGYYAAAPKLESGMRPRRPLTSSRLLLSYCDRAAGQPGVKNARKALSYIVDFSASPKETGLMLLLCLPGLTGGYGLPLPLLNHRIDVGKHVRKVSNKNYYRCDLFWPEPSLAIEYDSNFAHTGSADIANDSKRRNALEEMGVHVMSVTWEQAKNPNECEKIARIVARRLGKPLRNHSYDVAERRYELRRYLLGTHGL